MKNYNQKQTSPITCDVCVIGAGAAGLSAALFVARRGYTVYVVTADIGGQTSSTAEIENYPGLGSVEGPALMTLFKKEALSFGAGLYVDSITSIENKGDSFLLSGAHGQIRAQSVIIATGKSPRSLGVAREEDFLGNGLVYSGLGDPSESRDAHVVVVGGGNSALTAVLHIAPFAKKVTLVHRRDALMGEKVLLDRVHALKGITTIFSSTIVNLSGDDRLTSVTVRQGDGDEREVPVDILIVALGFEARNNWLKSLVQCSDESCITIDNECKTNTEGIFAAGDCTNIPYQQIVISAGEGAKAGLSACRYLDMKQGRASPRTDWGYV